jgi:hypothetical protein
MGVARTGIVALFVGGCALPAIAFADEDQLGVLIDAGVRADNNVSRSRGDDRLSDTIWLFTATKSHVIPLTPQTRISLSGLAGAERFTRYDGLSQVFAGLQGEFQYRASGEFSAPTWGIYGRAVAEAYESRLRDGYRYTAGVRVLQPLTDRIDLLGALTYNRRDGRSKVFDGDDYSARFNLDYAVSGKSTFYLGGEYRRGDAVSSAPQELDYVDIAQASVLDDAFPNSGRWAYRFKARTEIATLGYNLGLDEDQSLDFTLRWARSTALDRPTYAGANSVRYSDRQAGVAYLIRF